MFQDQISGKVIAVADLHGGYDQLRNLLEFLVAHRLHEGRHFVFLGDFCDVGPDTASTIDLLLDFQKKHAEVTFLSGNHDLNLTKALGLVESPHQALYRSRVPTRNVLTLASYEAKDAAELLVKMPQSHKDFLANLPWVVEHSDFVFVHAGLKADEPYEQQMAKLRTRDATLFKPPWLHDTVLAWAIPPDTNKVIVSGHTILDRPIVTDRRILLDCGCGYGGFLTACLLPERLLIQVPPSLAKKRSYQGACRPILENKK